MLAVSTRRFANTIGVSTESSKPVQSRRRNATKTQKNVFVPAHLKLPKFEGAELKNIQAWLDKVNADPAKQARVSAIVQKARKRYARSLTFWQDYQPVYGVKAPQEKGLRQDVFAGVARCTTESWGEYIYALRAYQEKLQQDPAFLQLNSDLRSNDASKKATARKAIFDFINGLPTQSTLAKRGLAVLVRNGHIQAIKSGEAAGIATEYVNKFERELRVTVITAHKLSPAELTHYTNQIKNSVKDERTKVFVSAREDPSIMGGVIYDVNGKIRDFSWRRQHEQAMAKLAQINGL